MEQARTGNEHHADSTSRRAVLRGIGLGGVAAALIAAGWKVEATAQEATPTGPAVEANAIVVLFGQPTDPAAFEDYYRNVHQPLALQMPHLQEILGGPVLGSLDESQPEYFWFVVLRYANMAELQQSVMSPEGQEAFADVPNFATGGVVVFLTHLESVSGMGAQATPAT
ncbi:MAG: EthD family reductase [Chloroflexota bacterium]|nr:EthD family reductase [Chloroflexota bacterium]